MGKEPLFLIYDSNMSVRLKWQDILASMTNNSYRRKNPVLNHRLQWHRLMYDNFIKFNAIPRKKFNIVDLNIYNVT